jgi:transcriptional regulator with XRE-family HTH domain
VLAGLLFDINEAITQLMERSAMSRAQLAERLGTSRANVTQLLRGKPDLKLSTLVRIAAALDATVTVELAPARAKASRCSPARGRRKAEARTPGVAARRARPVVASPR